MSKLNQRDLLLVSDAAIRNNDGEVDHIRHHKEGFNNFAARGGLAQIIKDLFKIEYQMENKYLLTDEDKKIASIWFQVEFTKVSINKPKDDDRWKLKNQVFLPKLAQEMDRTYSAAIVVNAKITARAYDAKDNIIQEKVVEVHDREIAKIPVMVRSEICNTHNKSKQQLIEMGEDPTDQGGYFIINGGRWIIKNMESVRFNHPRIFLNVGHKNEVARCEFISRPGDMFENSAQLIIRLLTSGAITCEITIEKSRNKFREVPLPFYILFRGLGISTDREIFNYILRGYTGEIESQLIEILKAAMDVKYTHFKDSKFTYEPDEVRRLIYNRTKDDYLAGTAAPEAEIKPGKKDDALLDRMMKSTNDYILGVFDSHLLPHIGQRPEDRPQKIRYIGYLINKMLMLIVKPHLVTSTDRDAYDTKRISDAGTSSAKVFKKSFNAAIVQPVRTGMRKAFKNTAFKDVKLDLVFDNQIRRTDLEKAIIQSIISGSKTTTIRQTNLTYRLTSQQLHHKNQLNVISALRDIETPETTSAGKDVRSDEMRRVHETFLGYVCFIQSADSGKRVGMAKQMAYTSSLCSIGEMDILKQKLLNDPDIIRHELVPITEIESRNLCEIFVNGYPLGFTERAPDLLKKYRDFRRNQKSADPRKKIHMHTSISYNSNEDAIYFDTDYGRIIRPLLIVERDPKTGEQNIKITKKHIKHLLLKEITFDDLINEGIVEYIAPEEHLNCMICPCYNDLWEARMSEIDYTHCEIPQTLMGIPALTSPYSNSNQAPRNVFQTQQVKQTCGWYALDWPNNIEKNTFLQFRNEMPLLRTISNKYIMPNGMNIYICILTYGGWNQEDSWIVNQSSIDRGLFEGMHFNMEKTELKKDEEFRIPDEAYTKDIPRHVSHDKLDERGFIRVGSIVHKNDVLIGKLLKIHKPTDQYTHIDKSLTYKFNEPAYIIKVIYGRNDKDREFCKVMFGAIRPPDIGDKFCLLPTCEVLTSDGWVRIDQITLDHQVATLLDDPNYRIPISGPLAGVEPFKKGNHNWVVQYNKPSMLHTFEGTHVMWNFSMDQETDKSVSRNASLGENSKPIRKSRLATTIQHKMYTAHKSNPNSFQLTETFKCSMDPLNMIHLSDDFSTFKTTGAAPETHVGKVHCITVPNHIFLVRENADCAPIWTGNSARSGQKGVVGMTFAAEDMPTTESGIVPDWIMNPHAYPTRMTINQDKELLAGRLAAHKGIICDATCFAETDMQAINDELVKKGYDHMGEDRMYNGKTGEYLDVKIYTGPCYYQRLQKFVVDEVYAAASGVTCALTRQPVAGKAKHGGLRIGEMEKDVLCSHGAMRTLLSKFTTDSDEFTIYVCRGCGKMPIVNVQKGYYICHTCGDLADISSVRTKWASKLFMQELNSMGIGTKFFLRPHTYLRGSAPETP